MPACVRIAVQTDSSRIRLVTRPLSAVSPYDFDLRVDGELLGTVLKQPLAGS